MKRLSSPKEQKRSGRSGVYYHSSYLGKPHDHLWMNTISPTLMYEELRKAYDATADRIWLLNAGDIKSCEFAVDYFLTMAFDIDSFNFERAANYRPNGCVVCWAINTATNTRMWLILSISWLSRVNPNLWDGATNGLLISTGENGIRIRLFAYQLS